MITKEEREQMEYFFNLAWPDDGDTPACFLCRHDITCEGEGPVPCLMERKNIAALISASDKPEPKRVSVTAARVANQFFRHNVERYLSAVGINGFIRWLRSIGVEVVEKKEEET